MMRGRNTLPTLLVAAALLALLGLPAAAAQQQGSLALAVQPHAELTADTPRTIIRGVAELVTDASSSAELTGIPITFKVAAPDWLSVTVSPASAVFVNQPQPAVTSMRSVTFQVDVRVVDVPSNDTFGLIAIHAITQPGSQGGQSFSAKVTSLVSFDAATPCTDDHLTPLAGSAGDGDQAAPETTLTPQSGGASTLPALPMAGVAAFGLIGAGLGLVLRRRWA